MNILLRFLQLYDMSFNSDNPRIWIKKHRNRFACKSMGSSYLRKCWCRIWFNMLDVELWLAWICWHFLHLTLFLLLSIRKCFHTTERLLHSVHSASETAIWNDEANLLPLMKQKEMKMYECLSIRNPHFHPCRKESGRGRRRMLVMHVPSLKMIMQIGCWSWNLNISTLLAFHSRFALVNQEVIPH